MLIVVFIVVASNLAANIILYFTVRNAFKSVSETKKEDEKRNMASAPGSSHRLTNFANDGNLGKKDSAAIFHGKENIYKGQYL